MSLVCDEHGRFIPFSEPFFVSSREDMATYAALAHHDIDQIPEDERRSQKCSPDEPGLDIYEGVDKCGRPNGLGNHQILDWEAGQFLFSISGDTAKRHLPTHYQSMLKLITTAS